MARKKVESADKPEVVNDAQPIENVKAQNNDKIINNIANIKFKEQVMKLEINKVEVVDAPPGTSAIIVENMGVGDVYCDNKVVIPLHQHFILPEKQSKTFKAQRVYLISGGRPKVKINFQ